jgi:hypothetical protein
MALFFFNLTLLKQLFAQVFPSPIERSSPVYSFQLIGSGKAARVVPECRELEQ